MDESNYIRFLLLAMEKKHSLILATQPTSIVKFDTEKAKILMDKKEVNGFKVGDIVNIKSLDYYGLNSCHSLYADTFSEISTAGKDYRILAFVRVKGKIISSNVSIRDNFCILAEYPSAKIVKETQNGNGEEILLFWAGGLEIWNK